MLPGKRFAKGFLLLWLLYSLVLTQTGKVFAKNSQADPRDEAAIKQLVHEYIKLKYEGQRTLHLPDYKTLVCISSLQGKNFLKAERQKQAIAIYHARSNRLRYLNYHFALDYDSITISPDGTSAAISLTESHEVVFEITSSEHSLMGNLKHEIQLIKEQGCWRIVQDDYEDYLWRILHISTLSKKEILEGIDRIAERPSGLLENEPRILLNEDSETGYERDKAVVYAQKWALDRNPDYFDFNDIGGDCTNFVSQALYIGGGIPQTALEEGIGQPGWFYEDINTRAAAWTEVNFLYDLLLFGHFWEGGPEGKEVETESYLYEGDLIQFKWDKNEIWNHSVIVVAVQQQSAGYYPLVASHSDDTDNYPFAYYDYGETRFLHINGY